MTQRCYRYCMIDLDFLLRKLGQGRCEEFMAWYKKTLLTYCSNREALKREPWWSKSKIVGDRRFVASMIEKRRIKDIVINGDELAYVL